jgi:hypothetical protein
MTWGGWEETGGARWPVSSAQPTGHLDEARRPPSGATLGHDQATFLDLRAHLNSQ